MKELILRTIMDAFDQWSKAIPTACRKGCSACCTQQVMITALEGERILDFVLQQGREKDFAEKLQLPRSPRPTPPTTNEYAEACLQGIEPEEHEGSEEHSPCPFLENGACTIYPVRPFGCRCFASQKTCGADGAAVLPDHYVAAAAAVMQIIEHTGQREYWGNMLDVLPALCDILRYRKIAAHFTDPSLIIQARLRTGTARPLPGFLLSDQEKRQIDPLLEAIFSARIQQKSIGDILNGR